MFRFRFSFDFMGHRRLTAALSLGLVLLSIGSIATRGLNFGIDFTGGTLIEAGYPQAVKLEDVRSAMHDADFDMAQVQYFGASTDVLVRIAPQAERSSAQLSEQVMAALSQQNPGVEKRRVEFVGPQIGKELTEQGGLAMLYALIGILIYIIIRFQWRLAPGAVIALVHDVIITVGFFSVLQLDFDLTVLAALLAVIGYSLNDTIVVFDRIRENFRKLRKGTSHEIINTSINQTMSRTIMTGVTTLLVLVALYLLGGEIMEGFALALIIGIVVGTYSSIFVASSSALALGLSKADLMSRPKPEADTAP
jgi:preprotein translocase subunit SecF